jgi:hypothetical protein
MDVDAPEAAAPERPRSARTRPVPDPKASLTYQSPHEARAEIAAARKSDEPPWAIGCAWAVAIFFLGSVGLGIAIMLLEFVRS